MKENRANNKLRKKDQTSVMENIFGSSNSSKPRKFLYFYPRLVMIEYLGEIIKKVKVAPTTTSKSLTALKKLCCMTQKRLFNTKSPTQSIKHQWSSGRIVPCHGTDPGSIPGWCTPR
jgi:hypothetical protein